MLLPRFRLALALATLSAGFSPAFASDPYCLGTQCFPTMAVIDPATGKPVSPAGSGSGGGSSGGAVYGPDAAGGAPSKPPVLLGLLDASGNVRALSPTSAMPVSGTVTANQGGAPWSTTDTNAATTITAPGTAAAKSQSVQASDGTALAKDASVQAVKTALGSPFQAGASIGNTAFGISGQLPAFAATPTFNIGTAPTITVQGTVAATEADGANTTLGSKADAASAATGGTAMAIFRQLHADLLAPTPAGTAIIGKVGIDQTTPGTTNKVSIGSDGTVALGAGSAKVGVVTTDQTTHGTTDKVAADLYVGGSANTSGNPAFVAGTVSAFAYANAQSTPQTVSAGNQPLQQTLSGQLRTLSTIDQTTPGTTNGVVNSPSTGATMTTSQPSVTTTAAAVTFSGTVHREIYNLGTANIYIGGSSSVTTTTGYPIPPGSSYDVSRFTGSVYAIAASTQAAAAISY